MDYLSITARTPGFRRAGRVWPGTPTIVPIEELTEEQLEQLRLEPELVVIPVADPGAPATSRAAGPAAIERAARIFALEATVPAVDARRIRSGRLAIDALQAEPGLADVTTEERDAHYEAFHEFLAPALAPPPDATKTA